MIRLLHELRQTLAETDQPDHGTALDQLDSMWADFANAHGFDTSEIPPPEFKTWVKAKQRSYGFSVSDADIAQFMKEKDSFPPDPEVNFVK